LTGPRGPRGIGRRGPRGPRGARGPRGSRGPRGPRGANARRIPHLWAPKTTFKTAYGPADGRDNGFINGRTLYFTKVVDDSAVRLMYYDNLRVYSRGRACACRWEFFVDGRHCPSGRIGGDVYMMGSGNNHRPRELTGYCQRLRKGRHRVQIHVSSTPGYKADCYTGWYSQQTSWTLEAKEVPRKQRFRKGITYKTAYGPADGRDQGYITGRTLYFHKKSSSSAVRVKYADNLRVYAPNGGHACRWMLRIDGKDCRTHIGGDAYIWGRHNNHRPRVIQGYCRGIRAGRHRLQVYVMPTPGYRGSDCYTGWYSNQMSWTLETEEVPRGSKDTTFVTKPGPAYGQDSGWLGNRQLTFTKKRSGSAIRLLYYDNLRVYAHGGGHACRWMLRVDGKKCPSGDIGGDVYVQGARNNHRPRTITGYCRNLSRGRHKVQVLLAHTPGYGGDCYTGWYTQQTSWTLEAKEI